MERSLLQSKYDWQYKTQDDGVTGKALKNHSRFWPRGKMLGGCSNINGMIYFRGNPFDYQRWYDAGNKDWHPDVAAECHKKAENLQDKNLLRNQTLKEYYGKDGPLRLTTFHSTYEILFEKVIHSWDEIGIKTVQDLNYANNLGSGYARVNAYHGRRESTDRVYLKPARCRKNLHVITNALVRKVLIHKKSKEAFGVEVERNKKIMKILANKEVILSTGTVNTPQLLMLSGIGSKKHLKSKNIDCIADLPTVGKYLQDHLFIPVTILGDEPGEEDLAQEHFKVIKYIYNQTGYMTPNSPNVVSLYTNERTDTYPIFQNHLGIFWKKSQDLAAYFNYTLGFKDVVVESLRKQNQNNSIYLFVFILLHPYSMGNVSLNTSNPRDHPLIFANYLKDSKDLKAVVDGIKMLTKIVNTKYFKAINGRVGRINWPECNKYKLDSYDYWKCISINMSLPAHHPVGTAKMGKSRKKSVVNSRLKVHSVKNLRIVDGSVMPSHVSVNTNGPIIMIAERAASLIKQDHGIKKESHDKCF